MDAIEVMVEEHENIKRGLKLIRQLCVNILNTGEVDYDSFFTMIDFIRNYADAHHHLKEEDILFKTMQEKMGEMAKGPLSGMYIEHEFGRLFIRTLEEDLRKVQRGDKEARVDIIANAIAYTDLLSRHIEKENEVMYKFARRELNQESMALVNSQSQEAERLGEGTREKYLTALSKMEKKYLAGVTNA